MFTGSMLHRKRDVGTCWGLPTEGDRKHDCVRKMPADGYKQYTLPVPEESDIAASSEEISGGGIGYRL